MSSPDEPPRSGLRNPVAAVRGVGAGALGLEAVVLLLAIVPLVRLGGHLSGAGVGAVVGLAALCLVLAALLRYGWVWWAAVGLQVLLLASGVFHLALTVLGVLFLGVWGYVLYVRHSVLGHF